MQPTFNSWLGYFDLIDYVDKFVFLDTVQVNHQSWQTRNKLLIKKNEFLFSLPIIQNKSKKDMLIKDTYLDLRKFDFKKKLYKTLVQNYKKAKYFNEVNKFIEEIIFFETDFLSEYNINIIKQIVKKLNITTEMIVLSKTNYKLQYNKGDLILDLCKYFKTTHYISPLGSKEYLELVKDKFYVNNINVLYQYYHHPVYNQLSDNFIPYIGIFDLLYNEGFKNSLNIIRSGSRYKSRKF